MIGSDTAAIQGVQGAFWNTLRGFHCFWEKIDVICPFVAKVVSPSLFGNVYFHPLPSKAKWRVPIEVLRKGLEICRVTKPHLIVIHAYGLQLMSWGGWLLARKLSIPFVVEVHHIEGIPHVSQPVDYLRRLAAFLFFRSVGQEALAFRVVNRELFSILTRWGLNPEKVKVIYSIYLDTETFRPMPEISKRYDLIFVGRLVSNKGLPILLRTFELLKREMSQVRFLIVGKGPLERWLRERIALWNPNDVEYIPLLQTPQDIAVAYNQSKVVVCASYAEGGPRYVVEAMACGLPAVSTPVGLMKEIVQDRKTGFLLKSWRAEEMAEKVILLLNDKKLYEECSEGAKKVAAWFDYEQTIKTYAETYQKLIQG